MAQYSKPNAKDWLKFCFLYCDEKIKDGHISIEAKKLMVKIYLNNYENHIFNTEKTIITYCETDNHQHDHSSNETNHEHDCCHCHECH